MPSLVFVPARFAPSGTKLPVAVSRNLSAPMPFSPIAQLLPTIDEVVNSEDLPWVEFTFDGAGFLRELEALAPQALASSATSPTPPLPAADILVEEDADPEHVVESDETPITCPLTPSKPAKTRLPAVHSRTTLERPLLLPSVPPAVSPSPSIAKVSPAYRPDFQEILYETRSHISRSARQPPRNQDIIYQTQTATAPQQYALHSSSPPAAHKPTANNKLTQRIPQKIVFHERSFVPSQWTPPLQQRQSPMPYVPYAQALANYQAHLNYQYHAQAHIRAHAHLLRVAPARPLGTQYKMRDPSIKLRRPRTCPTYNPTQVDIPNFSHPARSSASQLTTRRGG